MKKKILLFGASLMLTSILFTGCKSAVESALSVNCYTCTHSDPTNYPTANDVCDIAGIDQTSYYTTLQYVCTLN